MNIAEIRKKARSGKAQAPTTPPVEEGAPTTAHEEPSVESVVQSVHATATSTAVFPLHFCDPDVSTPHEGEDRLARLFSWMPECDELLVESYGSRFAEKEQIETTSRRWLAFSLGTEDYALEITTIREIIKPREITEIPRVPAYLMGIISLRGNIIPIFDMRNRLRLGDALISGASRIIICQDNECMAGLLIDEITQVVTIPEERIEPPPAIFSGVDRAMIAGVGRVQEKMLILLNLSNVLNIELDVL